MTAGASSADVDPSPYRWAILAVGASGTASFAMFFFGLPALSPFLRDRYDLSLSGIGLVFTIVSIGGAVGLLPWGILADRIGERAVFCLGLSLGAAAVSATAFSSSYTMLMIGFCAGALMGSCTSGAGARAIMGWFAPGELGFALGIRQMAAPLGGAIGALSLPLAAELGGLRLALLLMAGIWIAAAASAALWMRDAPVAEQHSTSGTLIGDSRYWRLGGACMLLAMCLAISLGFIVLFLHDERGFSPQLAATSLAVIQLGGAAARILSGRRSDRTGLRIPPLRMFAVAIAVMFALTALLTHAPGAILYPLLLSTGVVAISWNALSVAAAAELAGPGRAGASTGFVVTCIASGTVIAPFGFGALVESTSWGVGFGAAAAAPLLAIVLLKSLEDDEARRAAGTDRSSPATANELIV